MKQKIFSRPYYDYLSITKYYGNEDINLNNLNLIETKERLGVITHHYTYSQEHKDLKLYNYPQYGKMEVQLNIPYFLKGHNFSISLQEEKHVIEFLSNVLNTNLFKAEVNQFEYGIVMETEHPYKNLHISHTKMKGMKLTTFEKGRYYRSKIVQHRLYDAGSNFRRKLTKEMRRELETITPYNRRNHYIKIENRYTKPTLALKQRTILVEDLFGDNFLALVNQDLYDKYKAIKKTGSIAVKDKKKLSAAGLLAIALKLLEEKIGINVSQLLDEVIISYKHLTSPQDRYARKSQIEKIFTDICTVSSPFDLSEQLHKSLFGIQG